MGHGHVIPNPDGSRARCGGPTFCRTCMAEQGRKDGMGLAGVIVGYRTADIERLRAEAETLRAQVAAAPDVLASFSIDTASLEPRP